MEQHTRVVFLEACGNYLDNNLVESDLKSNNTSLWWSSFVMDQKGGADHEEIFSNFAP